MQILTERSLTYRTATVALRISYELIQVRTGPSVGQPTARGILHKGGSRESILAEMSDIWQKMRSEDGANMLERVKMMHDSIKESWQSGTAYKDMQSFRGYL